MNIFSKFLLGLTWFSLSFVTCANTTEFTLNNGLKVVISTNKRAPIVTTQLWYKVGSSYEKNGKTGISHALEHMMFKGSSKLKPGEASIILRNLGADENAFTAHDYTVYYQSLASDKLNVALEIEADRMATLALPVNEFKRELEVIKEERRLRIDDNPSAKAYELFLSNAYIASGYRHPIIGWMKDITTLNIDDLRNWYNIWYAPNNATLVIVGDITPEVARPMIERWFGKIPAKKIPTNLAQYELNKFHERRINLRLPVKVPKLLIGFNVPGINSDTNKRDALALMILSELLGGSDSSRLTKDLIYDKNIANSISTNYNAYVRGDSLFIFSATPNLQKNKTLSELETNIWQQIELFKKNPPSNKELRKIRAGLVSSLIYARDSINAEAMTIGMLESIGLSWKYMDTIINDFDQITAKDIQNVARRYLVRERSTTALVQPKGVKNK